MQSVAEQQKTRTRTGEKEQVQLATVTSFRDFVKVQAPLSNVPIYGTKRRVSGPSTVTFKRWTPTKTFSAAQKTTTEARPTESFARWVVPRKQISVISRPESSTTSFARWTVPTKERPLKQQTTAQQPAVQRQQHNIQRIKDVLQLLRSRRTQVPRVQRPRPDARAQLSEASLTKELDRVLQEAGQNLSRLEATQATDGLATEYLARIRKEQREAYDRLKTHHAEKRASLKDYVDRERLLLDKLAKTETDVQHQQSEISKLQAQRLTVGAPAKAPLSHSISVKESTLTTTRLELESTQAALNAMRMAAPLDAETAAVSITADYKRFLEESRQATLAQLDTIQDPVTRDIMRQMLAVNETALNTDVSLVVKMTNLLATQHAQAKQQLADVSAQANEVHAELQKTYQEVLENKLQTISILETQLKDAEEKLQAAQQVESEQITRLKESQQQINTALQKKTEELAKSQQLVQQLQQEAVLDKEHSEEVMDFERKRLEEKLATYKTQLQRYTTSTTPQDALNNLKGLLAEVDVQVPDTLERQFAELLKAPARVTQLEKDLQAAKKDLGGALNTAAELKAKVVALEGQVASQQKDASSGLSQLQTKLSQAENKINRLVEQAKQKDLDSEEVKQKRKQLHDTAIKGWEETIKITEGIHQEKVKELEQKHDDKVKELEAQISALSSAKDASEGDAKSKADKVTQLEADKAVLRGELDSIKKGLDQKDIDIATLRERESLLSSQLKQASVNNQQLLGQIKDERAKVIRSEAAATQLREDYTSLQGRLTNLNDRIANRDRSITELEKNLKEAALTIATHNNEVNQLNKKIDDLEGLVRNAGAEAQIFSLQTKLNVLDEMVTISDRHNDELWKRIQEYDRFVIYVRQNTDPLIELTDNNPSTIGHYAKVKLMQESALKLEELARKPLPKAGAGK